MIKFWQSHKRFQGPVYQHNVGHPFLPGGEGFGFVPRFPLPLYLLTGTGYIPMRDLKSVGHPQVFANLTVPSVGVGVVLGQSNFQTELYQYDQNNELVQAG